MTMKSYLIGFLLAAALGSSLAYAGTKFDIPFSLTVNADHSGRMSGALGTTRNSTAVGLLDCVVTADTFQGTTSRWVTCQGASITTTVLCSASDPLIVDTAAHLSGDSYVSVIWDTNFTCTNIQIETSSALPPKAL
jgi:hypothetical protein